MSMHVSFDEEEKVRSNELYDKSSEITYLKRDADTYTLAYDRLLNALKKLYKLYNPTM